MKTPMTTLIGLMLVSLSQAGPNESAKPPSGTAVHSVVTKTPQNSLALRAATKFTLPANGTRDVNVPLAASAIVTAKVQATTLEDGQAVAEQVPSDGTLSADAAPVQAGREENGETALGALKQADGKGLESGAVFDHAPHVAALRAEHAAGPGTASKSLRDAVSSLARNATAEGDAALVKAMAADMSKNPGEAYHPDRLPVTGVVFDMLRADEAEDGPKSKEMVARLMKLVRGTRNPALIKYAERIASGRSRTLFTVAIAALAALFVWTAATAAKAGDLASSLTGGSSLYAAIHPFLVALWALPVVGLAWSAIKMGNAADPVVKARHWLKASGGWHGMTLGLVLGAIGAMIAFGLSSGAATPFVMGGLMKYGFIGGYLIGRDKMIIGGKNRLRALAAMKWAKWGGLGVGFVGALIGGALAAHAAPAAMLAVGLAALAGAVVFGSIGTAFPQSVDPNREKTSALDLAPMDPFSGYFVVEALLGILRVIGYLLAAFLV